MISAESSSQGRLPSPSSHTTGLAGPHPAVPMLMIYHQITRFHPDLKAQAMQILWRVGVAFNPWTYLSTPGILSRNPSDPLCQGIPPHGLFCCLVRTHDQKRFLPQLEFGPSAVSLRLGLSVAPPSCPAIARKSDGGSALECLTSLA